MDPQRSGVEVLTIGLSGAADATEVTDEFEGGEGVVGPRKFESFDENLWWGVRDNVEEEIERWVTCGDECWRTVFC